MAKYRHTKSNGEKSDIKRNINHTHKYDDDDDGRAGNDDVTGSRAAVTVYRPRLFIFRNSFFKYFSICFFSFLKNKNKYCMLPDSQGDWR